MKLRNRIMTRVYILFFIRKFKNPFVFYVTIFATSFLMLVYMVSVGHIIASTPHDISGFSHFWLSAFLGTKLLVKAVTLVLLVTILALLKDTTSYVYSGANRFLARA